MENYPFLEEYASYEEEPVAYQGFFTTELLNTLADDFSYKEEVFNLGLQLGISHSISMQLRSRYDSLFQYALDVILLWRETYNSGDFQACRKLDLVLRDVGLSRKAANLVSMFLRWVNSQMCCREIVESNAQRAITKLSKSNNSSGLRPSVVMKFNKWCRQQRLQNNEFNMALYFQLFGSKLYEMEQDYVLNFNKTLLYLNTSIKHHLPHDAFYLTVLTNLDIENNVGLSASYLVKEITEFLHPRRLAKVCDQLPSMDVVCQLSHALDVPDNMVEKAKFRHPGSLFLIAYDILYAWKQDCPFLAEEDQIECLVEALESIDANNLAFEIQKDFGDWQMNPGTEHQICRCETLIKKRPIVEITTESERKYKCKRTN